jgi:hypothetical protein
MNPVPAGPTTLGAERRFPFRSGFRKSRNRWSSAPALGNHTVSTVYTSGEESATETEVEHVGPLPTTTALEVTFTRYPGPQGFSAPEKQIQCITPEESTTETCHYFEGWGLGSITVTGGSDPAGDIQIYCAPSSWCSGAFGHRFGFADAELLLGYASPFPCRGQVLPEPLGEAHCSRRSAKRRAARVGARKPSR